jgi:hypothetical protein
MILEIIHCRPIPHPLLQVPAGPVVDVDVDVDVDGFQSVRHCRQVL